MPCAIVTRNLKQLTIATAQFVVTRLPSVSPTALSPFSDISTGPMSPWNDDALVSLRKRLKLNVSMTTGLTDSLEMAAGGFMSRHEAQIVRELSSNSEQIDKVIETLRGKTNEDFNTFCTMLRETNHVAWAVVLEKEAERFKKRGEKGTTCRGKDSNACSLYKKKKKVLRMSLCLCHLLLITISPQFAA